MSPKKVPRERAEKYPAIRLFGEDLRTLSQHMASETEIIIEPHGYEKMSLSEFIAMEESFSNCTVYSDNLEIEIDVFPYSVRLRGKESSYEIAGRLREIHDLLRSSRVALPFTMLLPVGGLLLLIAASFFVETDTRTTWLTGNAVFMVVSFFIVARGVPFGRRSEISGRARKARKRYLREYWRVHGSKHIFNAVDKIIWLFVGASLLWAGAFFSELFNRNDEGPAAPINDTEREDPATENSDSI